MSAFRLPVSQAEWEEVFEDSRGLYVTPEVTVEILAALYRQYWIGGDPSVFSLAAQKVLGVKVSANHRCIRLNCGKVGWHLAQCPVEDVLGNAPEAYITIHPMKGQRQTNGRPWPNTQIVTTVRVMPPQ